MAATHSYVITVGTTPVPRSSYAMRRAVRRGDLHRRTATHRAPAAPRGTYAAPRRRGGHRSPGWGVGRHATTVIYAGPARPRGAHRAGAQRAGAGTAGGRHRATGHQSRNRRITRTGRGGLGFSVVRAALPVLLLMLASAVFVSAWFGATGAEAFASIVKP